MLSRERERFGKKKRKTLWRVLDKLTPAASITEPEGREEIKKKVIRMSQACSSCQFMVVCSNFAKPFFPRFFAPSVYGMVLSGVCWRKATD